MHKITCIIFKINSTGPSKINKLIVNGDIESGNISVKTINGVHVPDERDGEVEIKKLTGIGQISQVTDLLLSLL